MSFQSYFQDSGARLSELVNSGTTVQDLTTESVLIADVFNLASENPMVLLYVVTFPFLFVTLALILWHFHTRQQWWRFGALLLLTLAVDIVLSIKVVSDMHEFKLLTGIVNTPFDLKHALLSLDFALTLVSGLVVFVVFEIALHISINEWSKLLPAVMLKRRNRALKREIKINQKRIKRLDRKVRPFYKRKALIEARLSGELPSFQELDEWLNSYMTGWIRHIQNSEVAVKARSKSCRRTYDRTLREISKLFKTNQL